MVVLEAKGLVKTYGRRRVVDGVDFEVGQGEIVGLLGPNGAGKTTLLMTLAGFLPPRADAYPGRSGPSCCWRARALPRQLRVVRDGHDVGADNRGMSLRSRPLGSGACRTQPVIRSPLSG